MSHAHTRVTHMCIHVTRAYTRARTRHTHTHTGIHKDLSQITLSYECDTHVVAGILATRPCSVLRTIHCDHVKFIAGMGKAQDTRVKEKTIWKQ